MLVKAVCFLCHRSNSSCVQIHRKFSSPLLRTNKMKITFERHKSTEEKREVIFESINDKGLITINRPEVLNVCNVSVGAQILDSLKECQRSKKMVIMRGQGGKAFSAGGDVRKVYESVLAGSSEHLKAFRSIYTSCGIIGNLTIPFIALLNGIAMGGGLGMAACGRYRVATETTLCAMPETSIGVYPDAGAAYFLPRLQVTRSTGLVTNDCGGRSLALFLALTGYRIKGSDNLRLGMATHMCSMNQLDDLQSELLAIDNSKLSNPAEIEKILQHYTDNCPDSKKPLSLEENLTKIETAFSGRSVEEIVDNLKQNSSEWASSVLKTLNRMSPTSLKIAFKYFEMGAKLDLKQCLLLDYSLFQRAVQGQDFKEGIRALLIDKDQKPRWNPSKLTDVSEAYINQFFAPLPAGQEDLNLEDCQNYR